MPQWYVGWPQYYGQGLPAQRVHRAGLQAKIDAMYKSCGGVKAADCPTLVGGMDFDSLNAEYASQLKETGCSSAITMSASVFTVGLAMVANYVRRML